MSQRLITIAGLTALAMTAASPASAQSPCCAPAVAPMMVYQPYELPRVYIVNQGPVYSGAGIYTRPQVVVPKPVMHYPYVGYDYPAYRDAYAPLPQYGHYRQRTVQSRTLRRPPGWFDK